MSKLKKQIVSLPEEVMSGKQMKAWILQQIAKSESQHVELMKKGKVKTYTLDELKGRLNK